MANERKGRFIIPLIIVVVLSLVAVAAFFFTRTANVPDPSASTGGNTISQGGSVGKITVGYLPIYVDLPLFVAKEQGFFDKRGLSVDLKRFESSPDMGTALLTGKIDAAASIATSVALSTESRDPGKLKVFLVDAENKDNYLSSFVVLKTAGITNLAGLKGKKIGAFPGPSAATFGKMVLEKNGLNPDKDVIWTELPSATQLTALETKTVDALFSYEPVSTQAVMEKNAVKLLPGAVENTIMSPWQAGVWVVRSDLQTEKAELTRRFVLAIYDAVDFMRKNPKLAKEALKPYTSIKPEVAQATPNIPFTKIGEVDTVSLQKQANILTERKVLSKRIDVAPLLILKDFLKQP